MDAFIDELINAVLERVHVSVSVRNEVERELKSHCYEYMLDAQRKGQTDEQIQQGLVSSFGDPTTIGGLFNEAHESFFSPERFQFFATLTAIAGGITGLLYTPALGFLFTPAMEAEVALWGLLMVFGAICAAIASRVALGRTVLHLMALSGFLLIVAGQVPPLLMWFDALGIGYACLSDRADACVGFASLRLLPHLITFVFGFIAAVELAVLFPLRKKKQLASQPLHQFWLILLCVVGVPLVFLLYRMGVDVSRTYRFADCENLPPLAHVEQFLKEKKELVNKIEAVAPEVVMVTVRPDPLGRCSGASILIYYGTAQQLRQINQILAEEDFEDFPIEVVNI